MKQGKEQPGSDEKAKQRARTRHRTKRRRSLLEFLAKRESESYGVDKMPAMAGTHKKMKTKAGRIACRKMTKKR